MATPLPGGLLGLILGGGTPPPWEPKQVHLGGWVGAPPPPLTAPVDGIAIWPATFPYQDAEKKKFTETRPEWTESFSRRVRS